MIGRTIDNYQIVNELGRGGMAVVYRAYQPSLNRYVAIKILPPQLSFDQQFVERFQREARAAARLRHPNIVVIHDVGHEQGTYYIVMEYLEGRTLKELVEQEGSLAPERAARIAEQVAAALDYAHQQGFVHRDVKPPNIFVGKNDHVTLTDFGIAKAASESEQLTRTGMLMGTPEYMSPEQAEGGRIDHRTDLYALGVVLYQMLVGRVPFRGTTPHAVLHSIIYEPPPPPRQLNPRLSPAVESVVLKSIAKRPGERFQRGADLTTALKAALAGAPVPGVAPAASTSTRPPAPRRESRPPARPAQRRSPVVWIVAAIAGVLVVLLALLALLFAGGGRPDETPKPTATQIAAATSASTATEAADTPTAGPESTATAAAPTDTPLPAATATPVPTSAPDEPTATLVPPTNTSPPPTATPVVPTPVPPTNTPKPPTATPTPVCAFPAQGAFANLWQSYRNQLGCPLYQNPKVIQDAEQPFENGHMFWRQDNDYAYVVYEKGSLNGSYQGFVGAWSEGDPVYSCAASPPPGKVQPVRGFGAVWCSLGGPSAAIGWGLVEEVGWGPGYGDPLVQDFQRGFIFRDSDGGNKGLAYVFFGDSMTFIRTSY